MVKRTLNISFENKYQTQKWASWLKKTSLSTSYGGLLILQVYDHHNMISFWDRPASGPPTKDPSENDCLHCSKSPTTAPALAAVLRLQLLLPNPKLIVPCCVHFIVLPDLHTITDSALTKNSQSVGASDGIKRFSLSQNLKLSIWRFKLNHTVWSITQTRRRQSKGRMELKIFRLQDGYSHQQRRVARQPRKAPSDELVLWGKSEYEGSCFFFPIN